MLNFKRSLFLAVLLGGVSFGGIAQAQESPRIDALEEQLRQLVGQVEELNYTVKQLQAQIANGQKSGAVAPKTQPTKKLATAAPIAESGVESIEDIAQKPLADDAQDPAMTKTVIGDDGTEQQVAITKAPGPKILGTLGDNAAASEDGGFQGQVLVPLGTGEGEQAQLSGQSVEQGSAPATADANSAPVDNGDAIEQVSLAAESPEALYERSNESLLRRQFGDAEAGFRTFVEKYPDHSLAGSAQYWLGETYYSQGEFKQAAQNFLIGYKTYPKSRRAPDSLLKLGISLNKLGQKEQGCAALNTIADAYPKAVDAKKRAQVEVKRAGC